MHQAENKKYTPKEIISIFGVSPVWANNRRILYMSDRLKDLEDSINRCESIMMMAESKSDNRWFIEEILLDRYSEAKKIKKTLRFLKNKRKNLKIEECGETVPKPKYIEYDVDEIKRHASIEAVLGQEAKKKQINRHWFLCPFHKDTTPSFLWNVDKRYGYCFVCNKGGDIISIYQQMNDVSFTEACEFLST